MRLSRFLPLFLVLTLLAGCMSNSRRGPQVGRAAVQRTIAVENWTSSDLRVYALYGGDITMLGTVRAMGNGLMRISPAVMGDFRLLALLPGATSSDPQHMSETIHIFEGQRISWEIRSSGGSTIRYGGN